MMQGVWKIVPNLFICIIAVLQFFYFSYEIIGSEGYTVRLNTLIRTQLPIFSQFSVLLSKSILSYKLYLLLFIANLLISSLLTPPPLLPSPPNTPSNTTLTLPSPTKTSEKKK